MLLLTVLVLLQAQPAPAPERPASARVSLSGRIEPRYLYREGTVNQAGGVLNGLAAPDSSSTNAWTGRFALRIDAEVEDDVSGVLELENRSFDEGVNRPLSSEPEEDEVHIKLGYIEVRRFLADSLDWRIGLQRLQYRNRPHDEAFFLDLGESEGFFAGYSPASGQIRNTTDRDIREAAGIRASWAPFEPMTLQAFWALYGEFGGALEDESVYGLVVNSLLSERASAWVMLTLFTGGEFAHSEVGTLGAGYDGYFFENRDLELFVEVYGQRGTLSEDPRTVRKEAYAGQAGLRWTASKVWIEGAFAVRSGDRHTNDTRDQAFQSCENENRFLILESAEYGLDIDTNLQVVRAGLGVGPFELSGRPLRLRLDVGRFSAPAAVRSSTGVAYSSGDWGIESDLSATWSYSAAFQMWLKGAWLADSDLLAELNGGRDQARSVLFGADLRF